MLSVVTILCIFGKTTYNIILINVLRCFNIFFSTAEEVKKKLNSLRTYYNKELKKKKSGAGTAELYVSGWTYYDALDAFLKSQVLPSRTLLNMVSITQPYNNKCYVDLNHVPLPVYLAIGYEMIQEFLSDFPCL